MQENESRASAHSGGSSGGGPGGSSNDKGSGGGDDDMPSDGGGTPLFVKFASLFYAALVAGETLKSEPIIQYITRDRHIGLYTVANVYVQYAYTSSHKNICS